MWIGHLFLASLVFANSKENGGACWFTSLFFFLFHGYLDDLILDPLQFAESKHSFVFGWVSFLPRSRHAIFHVRGRPRMGVVFCFHFGNNFGTSGHTLSISIICLFRSGRLCVHHLSLSGQHGRNAS